MVDDAAPNMFAAGDLCGQIDPRTPRGDSSAGDATHRASTAVSRIQFTSTETANLVRTAISIGADDRDWGGGEPIKITGAWLSGTKPGSPTILHMCLSFSTASVV